MTEQQDNIDSRDPSEEEIEALVEQIVDGWDMETLLGYAHQNLLEYYMDDLDDAKQEILDRKDSQ